MFQELQSLSEANKKRVLVVATIIIMVIVIGVWVSYFNSILLGRAGQNTAQATSATAAATGTAAVPIAITPTPSTPAPAKASGPGIWQDIENGFAAFANIFRKPSQYTIQPK
jgi:hypothetical protein